MTPQLREEIAEYDHMMTIRTALKTKRLRWPIAKIVVETVSRPRKPKKPKRLFMWQKPMKGVGR